MKLLHTTDLHFNKQWFKWIQSQESSFDIFCISGDLLESRKEESLQEQIAWITSWVKGFSKPLFICSGNHDIEEFENEDWLCKIESENYYCDNTKGTIDSLKIGCCAYLDAEYIEFYDCDILVTHLPPTNTKTATHIKSDEDWGDKDLTRVLKNRLISPKIILCGHMHSPTQTIDSIENTTIYNTGVKKGATIPNHHIINL